MGEVENCLTGSANRTGSARSGEGTGGGRPHTLLDAVLLSTALSLLGVDALDAVVKVVLCGGALLGFPALCVFHLVVSLGPDKASTEQR